LKYSGKIPSKNSEQGKFQEKFKKYSKKFAFVNYIILSLQYIRNLNILEV
jgi:hypothetical protein